MITRSKARRQPAPLLRKLFNLKWVLFGNDDDGLYGDDAWRAGREKTAALAREWWFRNPAHNFTWYVLGFADHDCVSWHNQELDDKGWMFAVTTCRARLYLPFPFIGYNGASRAVYLGWRPSGAFGIKFRKH